MQPIFQHCKKSIIKLGELLIIKTVKSTREVVKQSLAFEIKGSNILEKFIVSHLLNPFDRNTDHR